MDAELLAIVVAATESVTKDPVLIASIDPLAVRAATRIIEGGELGTERPFDKITNNTREQLECLRDSATDVGAVHAFGRWTRQFREVSSAAKARLPAHPKQGVFARPERVDESDLLHADEDLGQPFGMRITDEQVSWLQPLRAQHLSEGWVPLPSLTEGLLGDLRNRAGTFQLRVHHQGLAAGLRPAAQRVQAPASERPQRITRISWPAGLAPGTLLTCSWARSSWEFKFTTRALPDPIEADGSVLTHEYDLRLLTREGLGPRALDGLSDRQLVVRALRGLGYLDFEGRALLTEEDLVRNVLDESSARGNPRTVQQLRQAVQELLAARRLTTAQGSRSRSGFLRYPARAGESKVELVCWTPSASVRRIGADGHQKFPDHLRHKHEVRGHLRMIKGDASVEAADAFRQDRALKRLVGKDELPAGWTYVRPHDRGR
ncbi:hypothetical protein [Streptomyces sp. NPDC048496]|uniref:hypothetical protein n=1 Tax=Streptomyces sp. NPDC048496 TaxID=3365558 RepID=UPI003715C721